MILFILICWGLSSAITSEYVFRWFRKIIYNTNQKALIKLSTCPNCLSFWIGLALSFIFPLPIITNQIISHILYGLISFSSVKLINIFLSDKIFTIKDDFNQKTD